MAQLRERYGYWPTISAVNFPILLHLRRHTWTDEHASRMEILRERFFGTWIDVCLPILVPSTSTFASVHSVVLDILQTQQEGQEFASERLLGMAVAWNQTQRFEECCTVWAEWSHWAVMDMMMAVLGRSAGPAYLDVVIVQGATGEIEDKAMAAPAA